MPTTEVINVDDIFENPFSKGSLQKKIKNVNFFHTPPLKCNFFGNFAVKKGHKQVKMRKSTKKHPFFHTFIKV